MMIDYSLIFGIGSAVTAVFVILFALRIYQQTKGATKGWYYLSLYGLVNGILSFLLIVYALLDSEISRFAYYLFHPLATFTIGLFVIKSVGYFLEDFGLDTRFNNRTMLQAVYPSILMILALMALFKGINLYVVDALGMLTMGFGLLVASASFYRLAKKTRKVEWVIIYFSSIIPAIAAISLTYIGGCCHLDAPLAGQTICENTLRVVTPFPQYCSAAIAGAHGPLLMLLLLGLILSAIGYGLIYRKLH